MGLDRICLVLVSFLSAGLAGCSCGDNGFSDDGADADTDVDTDADTDGDTDTGTGTGSDTGTDTGSDTDTGSNDCGGCDAGDWCELQPEDAPPECVDDCAVDRQCAGQTCCPEGTECVAGGCPLPDLEVDVDYLDESVEWSTESFDVDDCEVDADKQCVGGIGMRGLLKFSLRTPNIGVGNLHFGDPEAHPLFAYSECHGHMHFNQYAEYHLLDADGNEVGSGHKQAFCLLDFDPMSADSPSARYDCSYQGIQADWSDIYGSHLPCQWVDVTGVAPGEYTLRVEVNFNRVIAESNYANNVGEIQVVVE